LRRITDISKRQLNALIKEELVEIQGGQKKVFSEESLDMMMDLVQKYQYQYPIKSTIRELVSNAIDAIKERDVAVAILNGAPISEYYVENKDPKAKDSNFDINYYDKKWLSNDSMAHIIYEEHGLDKDFVRVIDNGVGLGSKRLEHYFDIGYSSKRSSVWALGKFGIGGKAALSTGIPFYKIKTRYNGKEFEFNVYSYKIESTTPSANLATGEAYPVYTFANGYKAYYKPTTEKNRTEIILEVKKYRKQEFIDAVKAQLLYFDNVDMYIKDTEGKMKEVPIRAKVFYEDKFLIVADNDQFSKPHMVLDGVNYGYVNFEELSLEDRLGNIGIKVNPTEVTINPSRESLVWDEATRATVLQRFKEAKKIAASIASESLNTTDFLEWIYMYLTFSSSGATGKGALAQLAGIVELNDLEPVWAYDKRFKIGNLKLLLPGIRIQKAYIGKQTVGDKTVKALRYKSISELGSLQAGLPFYTRTEDTDKEKLKYLLATQGEFYIIEDNSGENWEFVENLQKDKVIDVELGDLSQQRVATIIAKLEKRGIDAWQYISKSKRLGNLDDVLVPGGWTMSEGDLIDIEEGATLPTVNWEERRKLEERVVAFAYRDDSVMQKIEPKLRTILEQPKDITYYGTEADNDLLRLATEISCNTKAWNPETDNLINLLDYYGLQNSRVSRTFATISWGPKAERNIIQVAKPLADKLAKEGLQHVSRFFFKPEGDHLRMDASVIPWYTAQVLYGILEDNESDFRFMDGAFKRLNLQRFNQFQDIQRYINQNYHGLSSHNLAASELRDTLDKLFALQLTDDVEAIKHGTKELFGEEFSKVTIVDLKLYEDLQDFIGYITPIKTLLSHIEDLYPDNSLSEELEKELKFYITSKGL
jgi:hypothetical protein